jgi:DNA-binding response OmpR family regulator
MQPGYAAASGPADPELSGPADPEPSGPLVLIVDDDPQLRAMLAYALQLEGCRVEEAASGAEALRRLEQREPDVVLLDVLMPELDGIETCRRIRERSAVPIIMLTALGRDEDIVDGLQAGADDFCSKPVSLAQLVARIRAQHRRRAIDAVSAAHAAGDGDLVIDEASRRAIVEGRSVDLSHREYALLECLAGSAGRVVSHEQLVECVWGSTSPRYLTQLRSYIKLLRQKIEPDPQHPRYIRSRARMGYVLTAAPRVRSYPG